MMRFTRSAWFRLAGRLGLALLLALSAGPALFGPVAPAGAAAAPAGAVLTPRCYLPFAGRVTAAPPPPAVPPVWHYQIVATYPHDAGAFTEGLFYDGGYLYEDTGLNGSSDLRKVDLATGNVLQSQPLASQYFGEGIALVSGQIWQLTYVTHVGFIYDEATFGQRGSFSYPADMKEGWGLTYDGTNLIESDGTATIHFLSPPNFTEVRTITVTDQGTPVTNLNELEYLQGQIYANIFLSDRIAVIAPATGQVTAWIDLTGLRSVNPMPYPNGVLNGIAYDAGGDRLFVTGKNWSYLYQIRVVP